MHTEMWTISEEDQQAAETPAYPPAHHGEDLVRRGVLETLEGQGEQIFSLSGCRFPSSHPWKHC